MEDVARKQQIYVIKANGRDTGKSSLDSNAGGPPACPANGPAIIPVQNNKFQLALAALGVAYGDIGTSPKSFELSMNRKRKTTAQCDEILTSLQDAVQSRSFKAMR